MTAITSRRRRSEIQVLVISAPINYSAPLNEIHSEYPKFINLPKQRAVIVNNPAEEEAVLAGASLKAKEAKIILDEAPVPTLQGSNNEREMLLVIARAKNLAVNNSWNTRKIRKVIERACFEQSQGPSWL